MTEDDLDEMVAVLRAIAAKVDSGLASDSGPSYRERAESLAEAPGKSIGLDTNLLHILAFSSFDESAVLKRLITDAF